jgi:hypothetical protein
MITGDDMSPSGGDTVGYTMLNTIAGVSPRDTVIWPWVVCCASTGVPGDIANQAGGPS